MDEKDVTRDRALKRLEEKRDFRTHVVTYVVVNVALIGIWAASGGSYFWPVWPMLGWGIGLALHAWTVWGQRPITEEQVEEEMRRQAAAGVVPEDVDHKNPTV